jgi:CHASE3 domain sensor protein
VSRKIKWDDLDFNPVRDNYWATPERIKQAIKEKEKERRFARMITLCLIGGGILILLLVTLAFV